MKGQVKAPIKASIIVMSPYIPVFTFMTPYAGIMMAKTTNCGLKPRI